MKKLAYLAAAFFLSMSFDTQLNAMQRMEPTPEWKWSRRFDFQEALRFVNYNERKQELVARLQSDQALMDRLVEHADNEILARLRFIKESLRAYNRNIPSNEDLLKWVVYIKISEKKAALRRFAKDPANFRYTGKHSSSPYPYCLIYVENLDLDYLYRNYLKLHIDFAIEFDAYNFAAMRIPF